MCHWFGWYVDEGITIDEKYRNKLSSSNTHYESSVLLYLSCQEDERLHWPTEREKKLSNFPSQLESVTTALSKWKT